MIGDLARAVAQDLALRKYPHRVTYGPEYAGRDGFDDSVVFARDRQAGDTIGPALGAKDRSPEVPFVRFVAGRVTVYSKSTKPGATVADHEEKCDAACDGVITAMRRILVARKLPFAIVESRLLTRDELREEAEQGGDDRSGIRSADWPGCACRIRFTVGTAVRDVTYQGAAQAEGVVANVDCPVITSDGFPDYDPAPGEPT